MVFLDLIPLKPGRHVLSLTPTADDLALEPGMFSDIHVEIELDLKDEQALVGFSAHAVAALTCDRTLKPFSLPVSGSHSVLFVAAGKNLEDSFNDSLQPLPEPGEPLDLTRPIRDTLLLALPVRRVAPGADAEELPSVFGEGDDTTDPRWEALRSLQSPS